MHKTNPLNQETNCPVCHSEPANMHPIYGLLPGKLCQGRRDNNTLPANQVVELTGESIKSERNEYAKSVLQPFNSAGVLSQEYLDANGTKGIKATKKQIKNAKYIWDKTISRNFNIKKSK